MQLPDIALTPVSCWQGAQLHRLLEYRCNRYFYVDMINTYVPVPGIPKVSCIVARDACPTLSYQCVMMMLRYCVLAICAYLGTQFWSWMHEQARES